MQSPNEQRVERRLAAIFAADVAGYSRLMSQDEAGTLRALAAAREVMDGLIRDFGGRIANTAGDSVLAEFPSAVDAVQCGVAVQEKLAQASTGAPEDRRLQFRIGVHVGDVVVRGADLLGDGVNIAARLEQLCEPGSVLISGTAYDHLIPDPDDQFATAVAGHQAKLVSALMVSGMAARVEQRSPKARSRSLRVGKCLFATASLVSGHSRSAGCSSGV